MNIELGVLHDGSVMMVSDTPLPNIVQHVEYYREQRLFMVVYHNEEDNPEELMHYEVSEEMAPPVENTPNVMIYSLFPEREPIGYRVPLVQVR